MNNFLKEFFIFSFRVSDPGLFQMNNYFSEFFMVFKFFIFQDSYTFSEILFFFHDDNFKYAVPFELSPMDPRSAAAGRAQ